MITFLAVVGGLALTAVIGVILWIAVVAVYAAFFWGRS